MRASELRISNLISSNGVECKVLALLTDGNILTDKGSGHLSEFEPIPLTEEWLIKLGGERQDNKYMIFFVGNMCVSLQAEGNLWIELPWDAKDKEEGIIIKYVHQLQNLYFALTGKELKTVV